MTAIRGVVCRKSVAQTTADYSTIAAIAWDQNVYDTDGFHNAPGAATAIVIPASVNGQYGIFTATVSLALVTATSRVFLEIQKGGSSAFIGYAALDLNAGQGNGQATTSNWCNIVSSPILMNTGDSYTCRLLCADNSITVNVESSFGLYICDQANLTHRCWAQLNANQTTQNYSTPAAIVFDGADVYDTDNIHDPTTNNTKLIIPSALNGLSGVVNASVTTTLTTTNQTFALAIRKTPSGGAATLVYDGFGGNSGIGQNFAANELYSEAQTQVIQFNTGDAYEAFFYTVDTSITINKILSTRLSLWSYDISPPATPRSRGYIIR